MTLSRIVFLIAIFAAPVAIAADIKKITLDQMQLNETPLEGVSSAMINGTMTEDGAFGANAIMKDGSVFPPHSHPDARMSLVVSGKMYLGVGDQIDPGAEQVFEAGTVAITPAGVSHWMAARDGDVRILEIGTGPTETRWSK
ncbi:MAG: cupin domain-containing protein [Pseudomonadota bacterium]